MNTLATKRFILALVYTVCGVSVVQADTGGEPGVDYDRARWAPIHFQPAINDATDEQCLECHREIIDRRPLDQSPAGVKASDTLAWYQTVSTYEGGQDTFHRRHLVGPMATRYMDMKCNTCHQGNDPREETVGSSVSDHQAPVQRKTVDPNICLMCHGKYPWELMAGLTGPWSESGKAFGNNCMACHAVFRTNRHQVNYLKPVEIEKDGMVNGDVCYGCHGARAWYRISFPYPRHPWPTMSPEIPDWAKNRPAESEARFLVDINKAAAE